MNAMPLKPRKTPNTGTMPGADDARWQQVLARDARAAGAFVYAVTTTGVFCRCGCPSRFPRRENVRFFATPAEALGAGFRACRRCRPGAPGASDAAQRLAALACRRIEAALEDGPPRLGALAEALGAPVDVLRRAFRKHVGVTPRRYAETLRMERLRGRLRRREKITPALYDSGFGSSSRLYERSNRHLGMTPGEYRAGGRGVRIEFAVAKSPLGNVLVASTPRGICSVSIGESPRELERRLSAEFPGARLARDDRALRARVGAVLALVEARLPAESLPLDVRATAFQRRVWEALQHIPAGETRTYSEVAASVGSPRAVRAVARACATNPVALIVPCHRVVPKAGGTGGYRWGAPVKRELLENERRAAGARGVRRRKPAAG